MKIFFYIVGFCSGLLFHRQNRKQQEINFLGHEAFGHLATLKFSDFSSAESRTGMK